VECAEYRKYVAGDDTRRLDWKAYGRSDRYYIKEFEADTNLRAYLAIDLSGSMGFAGEGEEKLQYARRLASSLAYLTVNQGDAVGISFCKERVHLDIPPSRRPVHLQLINQQLSEARPEGETGMVKALHDLAEKISQRALVIIISDLFVDTDALGEALQHLRYRKHDIAVFHLMDKQEIEFNFERPHRFVDLEDGTAIVAEAALVADEYREALQKFLAEVKAQCYDSNADYHLVTTDTPFDQVLADFLTARLPKGKKS
jgi:uncharacterized protein (DUF58 family)